MGIEDFTLDLEEHADRILLVIESEHSKEAITRLLEMRSYRWEHATSKTKASELARKELYDAVIVDVPQKSTSPLDVIDDYRMDSFLGRAPLLLLHSDAQKYKDEIAGIEHRNAYVISSPVEASSLLVKLAMILRLRKMRKDELRLDSKIAQQNAQLRDLTNRFKLELKEAQIIQQSLLPKSLPSDPRCAIAACYVPLEAVGGDLYDVFIIRDSVYGLFIGDVTGHGLSAALVGAMTKMALAYASKDDPSAMFCEMNNGIADHMPDGRFVTVASAVYEATTGALKIARGGHPPPYIWRQATGCVETIAPRGMALGMLAGVNYELYETVLKHGDKLLMITDGICETTDMNGKMLGIDGVGRLFEETAKEYSIDDCLKIILKKQNEFSSGRLLKDDNTLLGLECLSIE